MRVLVTASARFMLAADGSLWTPNASLGCHLWARYLDVFDEVRLAVRAASTLEPPEGWNRATGPGVVAAPLPDVTGPGPLGYLLSYARMERAIHAALDRVEAVQLRLPCFVGAHVWRTLERGRPYGVEVVGDPYDSFAPGALRHPLRPFYRWWFARGLRRQCAGAVGAAYVTQEALQRRYPCPAGMVGISDVDLPAEAYSATPRVPPGPGRPVTLISVGTLAQLYKAPDTLLDAVALCVQSGLDLRLVLVGDGRYRPELERRAARLGLAERVRFVGQLTSTVAVRAEIDGADLFVLPSRQEGLPRAMLEAMARGLPCIGSTVGGIPELLLSEDLVPPGDAAALAATIKAVVSDPERMARMSERSLAVAHSYQPEPLRERRAAFYRNVRDATEAWLCTTQHPPSSLNEESCIL